MRLRDSSTQGNRDWMAQGAPEHALSDAIMEDVFRVGAYRANFRNQNVIVPWANI